MMKNIFKKLKDMYMSPHFWEGFFDPFGFKYHYHRDLFPNKNINNNKRIAEDFIAAFEKFHDEEREKGNLSLFESDAYQEFLAWKKYWENVKEN